MNAIAKQRDPHGHTVVVGLGRTGVSVLAHLARHGVAVAAVDSRTDPPGLAEVGARFPDVEVRLGPFDQEYLAGAVELVVSPGIGLDVPAIQHAVAAGIPALGDIELFARVARAPVVAITGSNGKSTVTTLVGAMAQASGRTVAVGGNLGLPALELLPMPAWEQSGGRACPELYVLELSSFQLETTASLAPQIAVFLNVSADHMDRYPSVAAYVDAKVRVFRGARIAVVNRDDPQVMACVPELRARGVEVVEFGLGAPAAGDYGVLQEARHTWLVRGTDRRLERLIDAAELSTIGRHNQLNALTALAIGDALQLDRDACLAAVREFGGLAHRCELLTERDGVRWVNDSKGTNVGATLAAIEGLSELGPLILIAGGDGKGADFSPLKPALAGRTRALILLGRDGPRVGRALEGVAPQHRVEDMDEAVRVAADAARAGDVVLLSPACASWDMYPSYVVRGERFAAAVAAQASR